MQRLRLLFFLRVYFSFINAQEVDEKIRNVIGFISSDSIAGYIQSLEKFGSRFQYNDNRFQIAEYLADKFTSFGFEEVDIDSFLCFTTYKNFGETTQYNVVATLRGSENPEDVIVIGGHYDSYSTGFDPFTAAPGRMTMQAEPQQF